MDLLQALIVAPFMFTLFASRIVRRRRSIRLDVILAEVEAASALVIADWPHTHTSARLERLALERRLRSASYKQGWHTAASREIDYLLLQRIGVAEKRLRTARDMACKTAAVTADHH
ncbi:hypothetical protein GCM10009696_20450 [Kocuria himachalensis]